MRPRSVCSINLTASSRSRGGFHSACRPRGHLSRIALPTAASSARERCAWKAANLRLTGRTDFGFVRLAASPLNTFPSMLRITSLVRTEFFLYRTVDDDGLLSPGSSSILYPRCSLPPQAEEAPVCGLWIWGVEMSIANASTRAISAEVSGCIRDLRSCRVLWVFPFPANSGYRGQNAPPSVGGSQHTGLGTQPVSIALNRVTEAGHCQPHRFGSVRSADN
jgi:hypothetical protein